MPLAAHAVWHGATLRLEAAWGELPATEVGPAAAALVRAQGQAQVTTAEQAEELGGQVAQQLRQGGAPARFDAS